jgi:hypothetical protein
MAPLIGAFLIHTAGRFFFLAHCSLIYNVQQQERGVRYRDTERIGDKTPRPPTTGCQLLNARARARGHRLERRRLRAWTHCVVVAAPSLALLLQQLRCYRLRWRTKFSARLPPKKPSNMHVEPTVIVLTDSGLSGGTHGDSVTRRRS